MLHKNIYIPWNIELFILSMNIRDILKSRYIPEMVITKSSNKPGVSKSRTIANTALGDSQPREC